MSIIRAVGLKKCVQNAQTTIDILKGVDLEINAGESVAIVGASGSGKTTLLSLLAGLDSPTSGEIYVDNERIDQQSEDARAGLRLAKMGFIFQQFDLLSRFTALENVMLPLLLTGTSAPEETAMAWLLEMGLHDRQTHFPSQLSGGEQQRVAIARAFVTQPKILFADEPTGNLDDHTGKKIIEHLFHVNKKHHTTLVIVTHDTALSKVCDRTLQLNNGMIVS